jgi:hypothetical protein
VDDCLLFARVLVAHDVGAEPARVLVVDRERKALHGDLLLLTQRVAVLKTAESARVDTLQLSDL